MPHQGTHHHEPAPTPAVLQFNKSSMYTDDVPPGYTAWQIRNDYPPPKPKDAELAPEGPPIGIPDAPWIDIDPITQPAYYMEIIRQYCFDGMVNNDFVPQKNTVRAWYHAPWMHYGDSGREPLHGLTSERYCPPLELSATQHRTTQTWAVGFFNSAGASVFGGMWKDPNNPDWTEDLAFPVGSLVYKLLFTNATDDELPILKGAPSWEGLIAVQPEDPSKDPNPAVRDLKNPKPVRLLQMDIAARDNRSTTTGWLFGTFMYSHTSGKTGWDGLIPVGLQWGNDPELTQKNFEAGMTAKQVWINPEADDVRISLHGGRPSWGWNGRLNGPADNFISACASCHSTAEWPPKFSMVPPAPVKNAEGKWVPKDDATTMKWFNNVPCGTAITEDSVSGDYSLQLLIGYDNYVNWRDHQHKEKAPEGGHHAPRAPVSRLPLHPRQGPRLEF